MKEGDYLCTPQSAIKFGQLCRDDNGKPAVSIKRSKKNEYEKVPISYLIAALSNAQESMEEKPEQTAGIF